MLYWFSVSYLVLLVDLSLFDFVLLGIVPMALYLVGIFHSSIPQPILVFVNLAACLSVLWQVSRL